MKNPKLFTAADFDAITAFLDMCVSCNKKCENCRYRKKNTVSIKGSEYTCDFAYPCFLITQGLYESHYASDLC